MGPGGHIHEAGDPGILCGGGLCTGQPYQQDGGLGPGHRRLQGVIVPGAFYQVQGGQGIRLTESIALQGSGGRNSAQQQEQSAEQSEDMLFHGGCLRTLK